MDLRVVYLDDEIGLCKIFKDIYSAPDTEVLTFTDPNEALNAIDENVDLVLLDYRLPNTTGEDVAAQIKFPVAMALVSGDLSLELSFKFDKVFAKPYDFGEMADFLDLIRERKMNK